GNTDDAVPVPLKARHRLQREVRPALRERDTLPGPSAGFCRADEIRSIRADTFGQSLERDLDVARDVIRTRIDKARRDTGGHMLKSRAAPQCQGSRPQSYSE